MAASTEHAEGRGYPWIQNHPSDELKRRGHQGGQRARALTMPSASLQCGRPTSPGDRESQGCHIWDCLRERDFPLRISMGLATHFTRQVHTPALETHYWQVPGCRTLIFPMGPRGERDGGTPMTLQYLRTPPATWTMKRKGENPAFWTHPNWNSTLAPPGQVPQAVSTGSWPSALQVTPCPAVRSTPHRQPPDTQGEGGAGAR